MRILVIPPEKEETIVSLLKLRKIFLKVPPSFSHPPPASSYISLARICDTSYTDSWQGAN
jgi:hypothetical protein